VQLPPGVVPVPQAPPPQMSPGQPGLLRREINGVPVWMYAAGLAVVGGGAYYLYTKAQASAADAESTPSLRPNPEPRERTRSRASRPEPADDPSPSRSSTRWSPSRAKVASRMEKWLTQRNALKGVTILPDADDAMAKGIKNPSPLINLKVSTNTSLHKNDDFRRWARREGLNPVRLDRTTIGLVPADNTKRGAEWEDYVDALREEGQRV
jgi:hypothetical protein